MDYWGYHLILDVKGCEIEKAKNPQYIESFIKELVQVIDMIPFGDPQLVHFGELGDGQKAGWTVIQLIETSSIVGHFLDNNGDLYMDVFSCKGFEKSVVLDLLKKYFNPKNVKSMFLERRA